jgi:hypothetical protein
MGSTRTPPCDDPTSHLPTSPRLPNQLLPGIYGVATFRGRTAELDSLGRWCSSNATGALALITGEGGTGKTRLCALLCQDRAQQGWATGFLRAEADLAGLVQTERPVLVNVDYAETRTAQVRGLLAALAGRGQRPWRVLLIARAEGDWWTHLADDTEPETRFVLGAAVSYELGPLERTSEGRAEAFLAAASKFAEKLAMGRGAPAVPDLPRPGGRATGGFQLSPGRLTSRDERHPA